MSIAPTDPLIEKLAAYTSSLTYAALPPVVVHETKRKLIDTLGCALGAYNDEPCRLARAIAQRATGNPPARVFGSLDVSTPELAAFANGVMVRAQDFNDSYLAGSSCHPSDTIPAVLAAAESCGADGRTLIAATVAAYETACNFADVMTREQGWDNTLFDTIGAATGSARAFGLGASKTAQAVALAITQPGACTNTLGRTVNVEGLRGGQCRAQRDFCRATRARGHHRPAKCDHGALGAGACPGAI